MALALAAAAPVASADVLQGLTTQLNRLQATFYQPLAQSETSAERFALFGGWLAELAGLILLTAIMIRLAQAVAPWLSGLQQRAFSRLQSPSVLRFINAVFFVFKTNAPWAVVLLLSQSVAPWVPEPWFILARIDILGLVYSLYRAARIILTWLMFRTYSRSGHFLASAKADAIIADTRIPSFTAATSLCVLLLAGKLDEPWLTTAIAALVALTLYAQLNRLLEKHRSAVDAFLAPLVKGPKDAQDAPPPGRFQQWLKAFFWPARFVLHHEMDALAHVNQMLMYFDTYRQLYVKVLRARLDAGVAGETAADEEAEEPLPDTGYREWMTRPLDPVVEVEAQDISKILEQISRWHQDKTDENVVVITGDASSGKTTLMQRIAATWNETPVHTINIERKTPATKAWFEMLSGVLGEPAVQSLHGLTERDASLEPQLILIDNAHNLFLSEVGLFDAYRAMIDCLNLSLSNIFWIISMHAPARQYLNAAFPREQYTGSLFKVAKWSPADIRKMLLARHKGGRYRLSYNELLLSATASSESSSMRATDSRIFNILWEQSGGNPGHAIELWLSAGKINGRNIEIGVPHKPSATQLSELSDDAYFIYAAIIRHRAMTAHQVSLVTRIPAPAVRHTLKHGYGLGTLETLDGQRFNVRLVWLPVFFQVLQQKNLL